MNYQTAKTSMTSKCKNLNEINPSMEILNNGMVLEGKYYMKLSEAASYIVLEKKYYLCQCTKAIKKKNDIMGIGPLTRL